jgi:adenine deaminase
MLKDRIFSASKTQLSDRVITSIQIVDVFTQDLYVADVAVQNGFFAGIGDYAGYGRHEIDGKGKTMILIT